MAQLKKKFFGGILISRISDLKRETAKTYCLKVIANQPSEMLIRHFESIL